MQIRPATYDCLLYRFIVFPHFLTLRKKGNVLFNDALKRFYLRLYCVGHKIKDHLDSKRGNPLPPLHELLFPISSKGTFYAPSHRQDSTYHGHCYTRCGAVSGMRNNLDSPPWRIDLMTCYTISRCSTMVFTLSSHLTIKQLLQHFASLNIYALLNGGGCLLRILKTIFCNITHV